MNRIAIAVVLFAWVSLAAAQSLPNLSTFGFSAEPGASIGTPCVVNAVARFWYRNFGVSTCGMYLP